MNGQGAALWLDQAAALGSFALKLSRFMWVFEPF